MSTSNYEVVRILNRAFGGDAISTPATIYFGLATATITQATTTPTEPSGNGYARVAVTNNHTNWSTATTGTPQVENNFSITFPESTGSWGTVTYTFVSDASSSGNVLYFAALSTSRSVPTGTTLFFAAGAVVVTMT